MSQQHNTIENTLEITNKIRDPIYGFIGLTDRETMVIDTPIFQRLRRIHQLALTKYVYPSAEHSRFVHSLGVMQCASLLFESVAGKIDDSDTFKNKIKILRYAALLHDIGHLPFSHATENIILENIKHEHLSAYIISNDKSIVKILHEDGVNPKIVSDIVLKKDIKPEYKLLAKIISGDLDADRADYLLRDSYFCGVDYGKYDFARYRTIFSYDQEENKLLVEEKNVFMAEAMLLARYHYNLQVPFHRTRIGYNLALKHFFCNNLDIPYSIIDKCGAKITDASTIDYDKFKFYDDYSVIEYAKHRYEKNDYWSQYLLRFKKLKPILNISLQHRNKSSLYDHFLIELNKDKTFLKDNTYFIHKETVDVIKSGIDAIYVKQKHSKDSMSLKSYSNLLSQMSKPIELAFVFVKEDIYANAKQLLDRCVEEVENSAKN